jgi:hypothetical protein
VSRRDLVLDAAVAAFALLLYAHLPSTQDAPGRDALYYTTVAASFAHGDGGWLRIGEVRFPPYHPVALSLLLAPCYLLPGDGLGRGLPVITLSAVLLLVLLRRVADRWCGPPAGVLAVLFVALAPEVLWMSRWIMTDVPATLATLAAVAWAADGRPLRAGLAVGAALALRTTGALLAPALLPLIGLAPRRLGAFALGLAPFAAFVLAQNAWFQGDPFRTGYHFHNAFFYDYPGIAFSARHALALADRFDGLPGPGNLFVYGEDLLGVTIALLPLPIAALAPFGLARLPRARAVALAGVALLQLAVYVPYFWMERRFLLPLVPLGALAAAAGAAALWRRGGRARALAAAVVLAGAALHAPRVIANRMENPFGPPRAAQVLRAAARLMEPEGLLVTWILPMLDEHYLVRAGRAYAPLVDFAMHLHPRRVSDPLPPEAPDETAVAGLAWFRPWALERGARKLYLPGAYRLLDDLERLARTRPVWFEDSAREKHPEAVQAIEERFRFEPVETVAGARIGRLRPR